MMGQHYIRLGEMSVRLLVLSIRAAGGERTKVDAQARAAPPLPSRSARKGRPAEGSPSLVVYRWIEGETAIVERIDDLVEFATTLAGFLTALIDRFADGRPRATQLLPRRTADGL